MPFYRDLNTKASNVGARFWEECRGFGRAAAPRAGIFLAASKMGQSVLQGARETIRRDRPTPICEVIPAHLSRAGVSKEELMQEIGDLGYSHHAISPADYLFRPKPQSSI
jgi:hypothetical protein